MFDQVPLPLGTSVSRLPVEPCRRCARHRSGRRGVQPEGRENLAHGASRVERRGVRAAPDRGERSILVSRVRLQGVLFRPCRGWRFGTRSPSLTRWATIWRPCRGLWPTFQRFWRTGTLRSVQLAYSPAVPSLRYRAPLPEVRSARNRLKMLESGQVAVCWPRSIWM
jgi:hypothetical protein